METHRYYPRYTIGINNLDIDKIMINNKLSFDKKKTILNTFC